MTFNPDRIAAPARKRYIDLGRQFGSKSTLQQANNTLNAWKTHKDTIRIYGFYDLDAEKLEQARDQLQEVSVDRESIKTVNVADTKTYNNALATGNRLRERLRNLLAGVFEDLEETDDAEAQTAAGLIEAALNKTSVASTEANSVANQLIVLVETFDNQHVATQGAPRGSNDLLTEVKTHCERLRTLSQDRTLRPGTPKHTELLDLLDGVIITLARRARRAAETASKELQSPAILTEFNLDALYPSGSPKTETKDPTDGVETTATSENSETTTEPNPKPE